MNGLGSLSKKSLIVTIFVAIVVGLVAGLLISKLASAPTPTTPRPSQNLSSGGPEQTPLPQEIGGLGMTHFSQGQEALDQIAQLHGKRFNLKNGYIGHYQADQAKAMLWISESFNQAEAQGLIQQMVSKIQEGKSPFSGLTNFQVEGKEVYSLSGLGQTHYIYQKKEKVIWLSVDPLIAEAALKDVLAKIE